MDYVVEILADSISDQEVRLTTFHLRYPRAAIHEDFLTHRDFSRNSSSSRAIPVKRMTERADWMPEAWGVNKPGMGADAVLEGNNATEANQAWYRALAACKVEASNLMRLGVAKEDANLLLRPFEWIDTVVTATRWENFMHQRSREATGQVRRQLKRVADGMLDLLGSHRPRYLMPGMWHLPYLDQRELANVHGHTINAFEAAHASAMRCARTSLSKLDGTPAPIPDDADACNQKLIVPGHWSPLEHPCRALAKTDTGRDTGNVDGWLQLRKYYPSEYQASKQAAKS